MGVACADHDVINKFDVPVNAVSKNDRRADRCECSTQTNTWVAHVARVRRCAPQSVSRSERISYVRVALPTPETFIQPNRNSFKMLGVKTWVSPTAKLTVWVLRVRPKLRELCFVEHALIRAWIEFMGVEDMAARAKGIVLRRDSLIEPRHYIGSYRASVPLSARRLLSSPSGLGVGSGTSS